MFRRLTLLLMVVAALLTGGATTAVAQPTELAQVPEGFPADLKRFVGGTKEFLEAGWFTGTECAGRGGDVGRYINEAMFAEPRLLYWTTQPEARKQFWPDPDTADVKREPPSLPRTFPAVVEGREVYTVRDGENYCTDTIKRWTTPANNTWGFTWAPAPDPESLERMKPYALNDEDMQHNFTHACEKWQSPYCQKAMFVDCGKVQVSGPEKEACFHWNEGIAWLFVGMGQFIDDNTSWLEKIAQFFFAVGQDVVAGGRVMAEAFVGVLKVVVTVAKFVVNPASALDDVANALHEAAVGFTTTVLQGLASVGGFDPGSEWFLTTYAASSGIGLLVMAFMAVLMLMRAASGKGSREELAESLFKHLPSAVFLAAFSPALAAVLIQATNGITNGIIVWEAPFLTDAVGKVGLLGTVTSTALPGGAVVGVLLFLFMVIGTGSVFVGLAAQSVALPMAGLVAGISWGMWVHPRWRPKALKVPVTFVGLVLSKPALFLVLGFLFSLIDGSITAATVQAGGIRLLTVLVLVVTALIIGGFAPWSLMRYAPLLPTTSDSFTGDPSPGFGTSAVVGATVSSIERSRSGGSGAGSQDSSGGGGQHTIRGTYTQQQDQGADTGPQARRTPTPVPNGTAGADGGSNTAGGAGETQRLAGTAASGTPGATTGSAAAVQGTTAGAAKTGAASGALGPIGVAAQIGVAGFTKARQGAHKHAPEADDDVVKGD